jgi:hypothetical protein
MQCASRNNSALCAHHQIRNRLRLASPPPENERDCTLVNFLSGNNSSPMSGVSHAPALSRTAIAATGWAA